MNELRLENYQALWLLWCLPFLAALYVYAFARKRRALHIFADSPTLSRINLNVSFRRQLAKAILLLLAVATIVIALTGPGWNPRPEKISRTGRDIVVLLDVSRSMLAEDLAPNRLGRAKIAITDLIDTLAGDRIGIIAFAGSAVVKCPLTQDYGFARMTLSQIDTDSVTRGGSLIGDAIRTATLEVFDQKQREYKDIILITDGEDHESFPDKAAERAAEQGIRVFVIGLGNPDEGARIPVIGPDGRKTFLMHESEEVWSKLNSSALETIALATPGGKYLNVATGDFALDQIYHDWIAQSAKRQLESTTVLRYDEKFQIFIALALFLLVLETAISERKKN